MNKINVLHDEAMRLFLPSSGHGVSMTHSEPARAQGELHFNTLKGVPRIGKQYIDPSIV